jgi:hypothetical protein
MDNSDDHPNEFQYKNPVDWSVNNGWSRYSSEWVRYYKIVPIKRMDPDLYTEIANDESFVSSSGSNPGIDGLTDRNYCHTSRSFNLEVSYLT